MDVLLIVAMVVPWMLLAVESWFIYLLIRQHGAALVRQDEVRLRISALERTAPPQPAAESRVARQQAPEGLPLGTRAPDFALPDLDGRERRLGEFLGSPLLMVFFSTTCGYCVQMAPRLGELPEDSPRVLLVSRGNPEEHRRMAQDHGWRGVDIVLDDGWDVGRSYGANGTPTGYLVDDEGRIASALGVGADGVLALAVSGANGQASNGDAANLASETFRQKERDVTERARAAGVSVRDVSESRLNRGGLPAGTHAPDFTLPDLSGKKRSLKDFRGKRVLLVFSDPDCGPCDALTPRLTELHKQHSTNGVEVLMVSRGERKANRAKAKQHDCEFPVVLQKGWRTSKDYAMFGTPVAYLIDEEGVIAKEVAIGPDAILSLVH